MLKITLKKVPEEERIEYPIRLRDNVVSFDERVTNFEELDTLDLTSTFIVGYKKEESAFHPFTISKDTYSESHFEGRYTLSTMGGTDLSYCATLLCGDGFSGHQHNIERKESLKNTIEFYINLVRKEFFFAVFKGKDWQQALKWLLEAETKFKSEQELKNI